MKDLTIAPGPGIPDGAVIAAADLTERFATLTVSPASDITD